MRIFCFIFILYLLLLSWQPCQDLAAKDISCTSTPKAQQSHLHDTSQPTENDDCSPFCVCSCCQISTANARPTFMVKNRFTVSTEKATEIFYQNEYSQQHLDSIWQPPKFNFTA
jgi:hypothetical protein